MSGLDGAGPNILIDPEIGRILKYCGISLLLFYKPKSATSLYRIGIRNLLPRATCRPEVRKNGSASFKIKYFQEALHFRLLFLSSLPTHTFPGLRISGSSFPPRPYSTGSTATASTYNPTPAVQTAAYVRISIRNFVASSGARKIPF